jgi:hypothetical protein
MNKKVEKFIELFKKNLLEMVQKEAGIDYINAILEEYETQLEGIAPLTDPTAPENLKDDFLQLLYKDLEEKTRIEGNQLIIEIGDDSELGYDDPPDPTDTELLKTFVFILEGVLGEYAWIADDYYDRGVIPPGFRIAGAEKGGRVGAGFLISKEVFFDEGWDNYLTWEQARWGFSDQSAKDIFEDANDKFDWQPYFRKVLDKTTQEFKARYR